MKKRLISILVLSAMVLTTLAGCSSSSSAGTSTGTNTGDANSKPTDLSLMIWDRGGEYAAGMSVTNNVTANWIIEQALEELNINLTYKAVDRSSTDELVNAMMAGGTSTDIIMTYSRDLFVSYAGAGGLADLTDAVSTYADNYNTFPSDVIDAGKFGEGIYSIMNWRSTPSSCALGWIRLDWLNALGMEVPTTTAELEAALYAFQEYDPGNVGDNLVPWAMPGYDDQAYFLAFVSSFIDGQFEGENLWVYQDEYAAFHPETKEGYAKLNQYYHDGIIKADFVVDTNKDTYKADIANGYAGFYLDGTSFNTDAMAVTYENIPDAIWYPVTCFTGSDDVYQGNYAYTNYGAYNMVPATAGAEQVVAAVQFLDWMSIHDNAITIQNGAGWYVDEYGITQTEWVTTDEKITAGYASTTGDYNLINKHFIGCDDVEALAASANAKALADYENGVSNYFYPPTYEGDYGLVRYTASTYEMMLYPAIPAATPMTAKYGTAVTNLLVPMAFRLIACDTDKFDAVYEAEMNAVNEAGLTYIIEEKLAYYNEYVK